MADILTERQQQVWALLLERRTHREIARELGMATQTVRKHIVSIWDRICVNRYGEELLQTLSERSK